MSVRTTSKLKHMPPSRLRTPRSESMDDGGGDGDGRHEGARAAILAGVDTSPVLKPLEHILDLVPTAVEQDVMRDQHFQVGSAARNQLASQPLSPGSVLDFGKASIMSAAPL